MMIRVLISTFVSIAVTESCDAGSCHPGVGNLLIGREANLSASSTCGLDGRQERFCMISELGQPSKCFACDSRRLDKSDRLWRFKYHAVKTMVPSSVDKDRDLLWWKADNGVQEVSIQLDLEAEFHFTHLLITFAYFRPAAMLLERSMDFGRTWSSENRLVLSGLNVLNCHPYLQFTSITHMTVEMPSQEYQPHND